MFDSSEYNFLFSIISLAAPFPDNSKAFIFADSKFNPHRFVILVNSKLDPQTQAEEVMAEIGAHVRPHVCNCDNQILANGKLI
jgi:hypothetical protein